MGDVPLTYGQVLLHALRKDKPMVSSECGLSIKAGNGESKLGGILGGECGILKKQSLMPMMEGIQAQGSITGEGSPGWRGPISSMVSLILPRWWRNLHLSLLAIFNTKTGEFQSLVVHVMGPLASCSATKSSSAHSFTFERGHCLTQNGSTHLQMSQGIAGCALSSAAPIRNPSWKLRWKPPIGIEVPCPTG